MKGCQSSDQTGSLRKHRRPGCFWCLTRKKTERGACLQTAPRQSSPCVSRLFKSAHERSTHPGALGHSGPQALRVPQTGAPGHSARAPGTQSVRAPALALPPHLHRRRAAQVGPGRPPPPSPPPPLSLPTPSRVASLVFLRGARPPRAPADVAAARHGPAAGSAALIWARAPGGRRGGSRPRSQPGRPLPNSSRAVSGERAGSEDVASQPPPDCWRARVGSLPRPYLLPPSGWLPKAQSKREMQTNWPLLDALGEFLSALGP